MKKSTLYGALLAVALAPGYAMAQDLPASTSTDLYDLSPWNNDAVLELFAKAADDGRQFPTKEEFEAAGIYLDLEFMRSHTRQGAILEQNENVNVVPEVYPTRKLFMNIPGGFGKGGGNTTAGYPSNRFGNDVFSMWNYTSIFGSWNYGLMQAPGSWIDAAHRNGTKIYSGIKFFESWTPGSQAEGFAKFITTKNEDGSFRYVDAIINACIFFGSDGINYNMEDNAYTQEDWTRFHQALYKRAAELGLKNFGAAQYTQNAALSTQNVEQLYGNTENGRAFDCFLNYSNGDFNARGVPQSLKVAKEAMGTADGVYQGVWIVGMDRNWTAMMEESRKEMNLCLWGEHDQSRFWQYAVGTNTMNIQENYQILLERSFSGGNRNPLNRPEMKNEGNNFQVAGVEEFDQQMTAFGGIASLIPERSAIQGNLPFNTYFSLGNGEVYFYKGKQTTGAWYNMSQQDVVPTYRWLVTAPDNMNEAADNIDVRFTHEDGYIGGSCIRLAGTATATGTDVVLYRTKLTVSAGNPKAVVALKNNLDGTNASNLAVIVKKEGASNFIEVPCGDLVGNAWQQKELAISGLAQGDVIEYIGLRVKGSADNYKMNVGQLMIKDDLKGVAPAPIDADALVAEVKAETQKAITVKLNWSVKDAGYNTPLKDRGMVYNDEVNIDHFEIFYKNGNDGKPVEVARCATWSALLPDLAMDQTANPFIGVRSVSTDLVTASDVVWLAVPRYTGELPEVKEEDPYGRSYLSNLGGQALEDILANIYWEDIKTEGADQNLAYHMDSNPAIDNPDNYYYATDHVFKVAQGQTITMTLKGFDSGTGNSLKYDFVKGYIDYDGNCSFLDADEELFLVGNLNAGTPEIVDPGVTVTFTIPADAATGASRLRIVGSDAWGAHPGPIGGTWKGYSLDFPVEITGDNAGREAEKTYKDYRDKGEAEDPLSTAIDAITIEGGVSPEATMVDNVLYFNNVEKAWIYNVNGQMVKFVNGAESASVASLSNGVYIVKMQNGRIVRSQKIVKK